MNGEVWLVELELKRIQTYLFQVPRLRAMIGANALVGETLRGVWDGTEFSPSPASLPRLAQEHGSVWPKRQNMAGPQPAKFPRNDDPLECDGHWQDDVAAVAETGVLTRDGGHFEAVFPDEASAQRFVEQARNLISEKLPGASLQVRRCKLEEQHGRFTKPKDTSPDRFEEPQAVFDLAQAQICQLSGREPATGEVHSGEEPSWAGPSSKACWDRGSEFDQGNTRDVLGILRGQLMKCLDVEAETERRASPKDRRLPAEFSDVATAGYLAVVHVDGNSVGKRFDTLRKRRQKATQEKPQPADFFGEWADKETFFHTLRSGMRRAVLAAIEETFRKPAEHCRKIPVRLLMLGGDDLLLVCGAPYALPFVCNLARHLQQETRDLPDESGSKRPLDIGAGVAIVQASFPFHRAHQLAEQLAESAKRIKHLGSAVDWIVTSESWYGDIADTRRRTAVIADAGGTLVLSRKPYPIEDSNGMLGLRSLLADAQRLADAKSVARSQLQRLGDSLSQGRHTAQFVAQTLPHDTRKPLRAPTNYLGPEDDAPWIPAGDQTWTTRLMDLFELYELERLRPMQVGEADGDANASGREESADA